MSICHRSSPALRVATNRDRNPGDSKFFDNQQSDRWLTTEEAAAYLRINPKSLLNLASNGKVPHYKLGRRNRYPERDLRELLLAERRGVSNGD
jgi:excisionase family DNA binding protein